ncbi:ATG8-interacting protein 2-like [Nymphaea colorata]|nr:ATG8-interacting protein 2-like [Nymphaea colorata]XP_031502540.1 ATG8-interacting protein 2-like [Nymphaea colorata]
MADGEKDGEGTATRGNDWEVVSLTASAYAAYPGPRKFDEGKVDEQGELTDAQEEGATPMFLSNHFVPPSGQHENLLAKFHQTSFVKEHKSASDGVQKLPEEVPSSEICDESVSEVDDPMAMHKPVGEGEMIMKTVESWNFNEIQKSVKGLGESDSLHEIPFFDEKGKNLPRPGKSFKDINTLGGLDWIEPIQRSEITVEQKLEPFCAEADKSGSTTFNDSHSGLEAELHKDVPETEASSLQLDYVSDSSESSKLVEGRESKRSDLPCEAWWKRQAASLYAQAREANALWSVFVAAAVMGLVILGHRWQQEKLHIQQLKWQFSINDEKLSRLLAPVSRFKGALLGQRRAPVLGCSNSVEQ